MNNLKSVSKQHGTVLVLALLLLFVMTLLGVSTMNTSTMEERMSGNANDRQVALQAAELALRAAEKDIATNVTTSVSSFTTTGTGGTYALGAGPTASDAFDKSKWWTTSTKYKTAPLSTTSSRPDPLYVIEHRERINIPDNSDVEVGGPPPTKPIIESFRITARATGITNNSVVILQSHWGQLMN